MSSTPDSPTYNNIFTNRYMQLQTKKPKLPIPFYARIAKYTTFAEITSTPTIPRKHKKTVPWILKIPKTNVDLTKYPEDQISSMEHRNNFQQLCSKYPNHQKLYTDTSKTDQGVGFAFICGNMRKKFHLPKAASIFTAEACAILEAFHHTQNNNIVSIIFTDSMSVIRAIENINSKTKHSKHSKHSTYFYVPHQH